MEGNLKWWLTSHFLTKQFAGMDIKWMGERGHMEPESEWLHFQVMLPLYFPRTPLKSLQLFGGNARQLIVEIVKRHGCDACMTWGGRQPSQTDSCGSSTTKIHYRGGRTPAWSICAANFTKQLMISPQSNLPFDITFLHSHLYDSTLSFTKKSSCQNLVKDISRSCCMWNDKKLNLDFTFHMTAAWYRI